MAPLFQQPFLSGGFPSMNRGSGSLWDVDDDFTSYASQGAADAVWARTEETDAIARVNITSDYLDAQTATAPEGTTEAGAVVDNYSGVSDTAWVLRATIDETALASGASFSARISIGMFSATSSTQSYTSQDHIGIRSQVQTEFQRWYTNTTDGAAPNGSSTTQFSTYAPTVQTRYMELIRTSSTTFTTEIFSDSDYTTSVEAESDSCASTCQTLDYIGIKQVTTSTSSSHDLNIPLIRFANGVTVAP